MLEIQQSKTADTRSCNFAEVSKEQLLASSVQHIGDVKQAIEWMKEQLDLAAASHDHDKLSNIDQFHADFVTGFKQTGWWDNHIKVNRHHIMNAGGEPEKVNLFDVLEMIADCVMAGMARTGTVYPLKLDENVLLYKTVEECDKALQECEAKGLRAVSRALTEISRLEGEPQFTFGELTRYWEGPLWG